MIALKRLATDLFGLLFPELCNACGTHLYYGEKEICSKCLYQLPYTDFHLHPENAVAKQFWGRLPLQNATALLYFKKGGKVQNLMHGLKYKGKTEVGEKLGELLGEKLNQSNEFKNIDLIVPVPLHPKRERQRGYNQSEFIAKGLAKSLQVPHSTSHLLRTKVTQTQTKKSRYTRYENMETVFSTANNIELIDQNILLVDDVVTTGATLEACGNVLLQAGVKQLNIAAVAFAQ